MITDEVRFWRKVKKTESCWLWIAGRRQGYGRFWSSKENRALSAHRFSWELVNGTIPPGLEVHHTCKNEACVNPAHMELHTEMTHPGTQQDINRNKTHCIYGHPYTFENTRYYTTVKGGLARTCRECERLRSTRRRAFR